MRVVVIVGFPGVPWETDWVKASGYAAEVIRLSNTDALTWPRVEGAPYLAQDPDDPRHYQIKTFGWRPSRILGRVSHTMMARRYRRAVRYIARTHGTVDVVHAHFYWAHYLVAMKRELAIPYVVTEHHTSWQGHWTEPPPSPLGIKRARELYAGAATVVTVCGSLRDKITAYGLTGNFEVVYNPVDASGFALPAPDAGRASRRDTVEFVSVARLAPAKGFDVLIDAFAAASREDPRLRLTIVGDGRERPKLEEQAARSRVADVVTFAGRLPRSEIARLLSESDAFVLASRAENLTVAVLEAWCAGLPVVTTDVGGHAEVMEPHLGHLVPSEDTAALAAALRAVADAPEAYDRHRIAVEARKKFAPEAVGAELERIYRSAVAGGKAGSV
ncbi:glycosyltransferase family 4 protein [Yinghuangia sp. ASG 101]|uniref:glycosyltransferase family 4 protein n=1 Tax=Yinghuangia sp. ASG 101 TaxID=2896848 RepID=UPI001E60E588|nr:glycosyltransferase family 4 protein [Yinghuangia sp. ASG 101]UGQ10579.1 glycosyltransferase family 4 protein [Yinghuangia sp. ASG 101]